MDFTGRRTHLDDGQLRLERDNAYSVLNATVSLSALSTFNARLACARPVVTVIDLQFAVTTLWHPKRSLVLTSNANSKGSTMQEYVPFADVLAWDGRA